MITVLNYILEANLALLMTLMFYALFLRGETMFTLMRVYLLASAILALTFPLLDFQPENGESAVSIGNIVTTYWLPEVVFKPDVKAGQGFLFNWWTIVAGVYLSGFIVTLSLTIAQLIRLFRLIRKSRVSLINGIRVVQSEEDKPTFSFFNFIFIGRAGELTPEEKKQIILHESIHVRHWHSLDILLIHVLKVLFWFNPLINIFKQNLVQIHEFEADERAVKNIDVKEYCSLLARVALQSAGFKLANHFNNSLTVKRIEMMKKIKTKIQHWKIAALVSTLPIVFFLIACQDQIEDSLVEITKNSTHALIVPPNIQERFEFLKKENPDKDYVLLELNETASEKIADLESKYGLPKKIEVYKVGDGASSEVIAGKAEGIILSSGDTDAELKNLSDPSKSGHADQKALRQTFAILEYTDEADRISQAAANQGDKVFTVVEEMPEFPGGYEALISFIRKNLRYPKNARMQGIEGTVFAEFIVEMDGSLSSVSTVRGISPECDQEVERVVKLFPAWEPGKQNGEPVRVKFVLPVKFNL